MGVYIYGLVDPRDGLIHYVGRTKAALHTRLSAHKSDTSLTWDGKARGAGEDKIQWLLDLKAAGLSPTIKVLEDVEEVEALGAERRWVQQLFKAGVPLTNRQWRPPTCVDDPTWLRGYAAALVELHRLSGQSLAVRDTLSGLGVSIERFKRAGVADVDLQALSRCAEAEDGRKRRRRTGARS